MTDVDARAVTADRVVAAALAGSAAASAAVPTDLGPASEADSDATSANAVLAWRWVVGTEALDLYAVQASSPHWRTTCLGAGGALHRAGVALAAEGLAPRVMLLPDGAGRREQSSPEATHLARLVVAGTIEVTDEARALYEATDAHDGRRGGLRRDHPRRSAAPSRGVVRDLVGAARAEGVRLRLIRDHGELIGLLHGPDTREAWLRAGMAASAVRLLARQHGLTTTTTLAVSPPARHSTRRSGASLPGTPAPRPRWRRIGDREGWLTVGIGTPYLRLRVAPASG